MTELHYKGKSENRWPWPDVSSQDRSGFGRIDRELEAIRKCQEEIRDRLAALEKAISENRELTGATKAQVDRVRYLYYQDGHPIGIIARIMHLPREEVKEIVYPSNPHGYIASDEDFGDGPKK